MMKNRGELKKLIVIELVLLLCFLAVFSNMLYKQYRAYTAYWKNKRSYRRSKGEIPSG